MKISLILFFLILATHSVTAQVTEPHIAMEKDSSNRLSISETELDLLKIKFVQNEDTNERSEGSNSKNPSNRLSISKTEQEILKNRFILSAENATKNENRKKIVGDPQGLDFFQNKIKVEQ